MNKRVSAIHSDTSQEDIVLRDIPDICPLCHKHVAPKLLSTQVFSDSRRARALYRCTSNNCEEVFIGIYTQDVQTRMFTLRGLAPRSAQKTAFPDSVQNLSPTFIEIYDQAMDAESRGLAQLVGIGLRKALEFLIKDYCTSKKPNEKDAIQRLFLGNCIEQYVDDQNIKNCAKRAVWLGNDEAHYVRKWEDKDISDLKTLLRLTVNWIDNTELTSQYIASME